MGCSVKSVTILITNHNAGDTVALCIESIRKYTRYPYSIIVYDDATDSEQYDDLTYLREVHEKGWIRLIEGNPRIMHGKAVSRLLDETNTDLALIMDCDIQIKSPGWLEGMVEAQESTNACLVGDMESLPDGDDLQVAFSSWFFMLDMVQYPHVKAEWCYTPRKDSGIRPTGWQIWKKITDQGRIITPLPVSVKKRFYHHIHISVLSLPKEGANYEIWKSRYARIQAELKKLRSSQ
jgi:glycosyltransferase involved in cell wall biosynthesis